MADAPFPSPNVENYFIGKGQVYLNEVGGSESGFTLVGNVPKFEFTPKPELLKHYSSMAPTKTLDFMGVKSKEGEVSIEVEEFTPDNLIVALLGDLNSDGSIDIMGADSIYRHVRLVGTNAIGARIQLDLFNVFFNADKAINLIDDNWGNVPLVGNALRLGDLVTGKFGTLKFLP